MERAKGGELPNLFFFSPGLIRVVFDFVSEDVWSWDLFITSFLQSRYLHEREWITEKPSHDRQSGLPWTNENDV